MNAFSFYITRLLILLFLFKSLSISAHHQDFKLNKSIDYGAKETVSKEEFNELQQEYIDFLQGANEQLNKTWTPINTFLTALGLIIAIITLFGSLAFYFMSKEYKERQENSLKEFEKKYDKLKELKEKEIDEKFNEWSARLNQFYSNVEKQGIENPLVNFFSNAIVRSYSHSGWRKQKDIAEDIEIKEGTTFHAKISLASIGQKFAIYYCVLGSNNKQYWFGFAGGKGNKKGGEFKTHNEYSTIEDYDNEDINLTKNIFEYFNQVFGKESDINPLRVVKVRLRGSDENSKKVTFMYSFA